MNQKLTTILLVTICSVLIFSCKSKEDNGPSNQFTYSGKSYTIKSGITDLDGSAGESPVDGSPIYYHDLYLMTEGLTATGGDIEGKGSLMSITLVSATATIDAGTYTFNDNEDADIAGTMKASLYINLNTTDLSGDRNDFTAGKIVVTKAGSVYTVDVDATANSAKVVAHFSGTVSPL